jgi:hypothetical protein
MRPVRFTLSAAGSQLVPLDWRAGPINVAINAVVSGTVTYTITQTLDDPYAASAPTNFFAVGSNFAAATTSQQGSLVNVPATALNVTYSSGTGTLSLEIVTSSALGV